MSSVWTIVLAFIALVFFSISATVHGDCASCCQGKWSQCFTICEDMDQCSECTEEKETCVGNCPGSCSLKSAASISSSSFRRTFAKANNLKMHKFERRLRKFVKRLNRRQIAWECNASANQLNTTNAERRFRHQLNGEKRGLIESRVADRNTLFRNWLPQLQTLWAFLNIRSPINSYK